MRALGREYGVAHTTLVRYFRRPEVVRELRQARRALPAQRRAERQAAAALRAQERRLEQQVRRRAKEEVALVAQQARLLAAAGASPGRGSDYERWLDEQDLRLPVTRADLRSRADEQAAAAVARGGGVEAVIAATGLRTRVNVLRLIEPAVLVRALANDAAARRAARQSPPPEQARLRRLKPDRALLQRRAAGEPLRALARDYNVTHTTLSRYFARPKVAAQLSTLARRRKLEAAKPTPPTPPTRWSPARALAEQLAATLRQTLCPTHQRRPQVSVLETHGDYQLTATCCCQHAEERILTTLHAERKRRPSLALTITHQNEPAAHPAHPPADDG